MKPNKLTLAHEAVTYLCIVFVLLLAAAMARGQTPPCIPPDGSARPCAWYERSYLLSKEQQEQILRGVLTVVAERYGYTMPITETAPAAAAVPDMTGWPSTQDLVRKTGISQSGILKRVGVLGIVPHSIVRNGKRTAVYDPDQEAAIVDYVDRRAGRKMPARVGRNFTKNR